MSTPYITVQTGETTILGTTDGASKDVTITSVITANSFIMVSVRGEGTIGDQDMDEIFVTAEFVDSTTIRFKRFEGGVNDAVVAWQVVTANADAPTQAFTVQTGEVVVTTFSTTASITDITDSANAMILTQGRYNATQDDSARIRTVGTFNSTTEIAITRKRQSIDITVRYWVIKWSSDFVVRKGTSTMTGATSSTGSFSAVTLARSMLFFTFNASNPGIAQTAVRGQLTSTTGVTFDRETNLGDADVEYYVVEFPTGNSGQYNNADWAGTTFSDTTTITAVDLGATIIHGSNKTTGTGGAQPRGLITTYLTDTTTVTMQRSYDGNTVTVGWSLMDMSGWTFVAAGGSVSTPPARTIRHR